nr:unnamed protein product [Spirometra erinaceieuropaei]
MEELLIRDQSLLRSADQRYGSSPQRDCSTFLTEKTPILQRWAEHFRGVPNRPSTISDATIGRLPQVETNVDLDLPPFHQETTRAVQQLSSGKAPGSDAIPAEVYKHGGSQLMDPLIGVKEMSRWTVLARLCSVPTFTRRFKTCGKACLAVL